MLRPDSKKVQTYEAAALRIPARSGSEFSGREIPWTDEENQGYIHDINAKCRDCLRLHPQAQAAA